MYADGMNGDLDRLKEAAKGVETDDDPERFPGEVRETAKAEPERKPE